VTSGYPVIEHREGRVSRLIRENRLRVAFLVALVETALVLTDVIGWFVALAIAAAVFAFHFFIGRKAKHEPVRQISWAAAVSQTLPVVVPIVAVVVSALLVLAVVAAAVVILAFVVFGRR
jgi:amino acid transporter